jgi:ketosteroid isomerase-like protein
LGELAVSAQDHVAVNRGDAEPLLTAFAHRFEHVFIGDTALGGTRRTLSWTRAWYERLYRLLPDITFDVRRVSVSGPPWNTRVVAEWRETNSGTDGVCASAEGVHVLHLAWGRATRLIVCPDTVKLKRRSSGWQLWAIPEPRYRP